MASTDLDTPYAALYGAVSYLAAVCDGAQQQDKVGYSGSDAWLGHYLARLAPEGWDEVCAVAAAGMLPIYRGQLERAGMAVPMLPDRDAPPSQQEYRAARDELLGLYRVHHAQQRRAAQSFVHIDRGRVILGFPYDPELVARGRNIAGRDYDGATKTNHYPLSSLPAVVDLAEDAGITIDAEVRAMLRDVLAHPENYRTIHVTLRDAPTIDQRPELVIRADYNPALNEALRQANRGRSTWDHSGRVHRISLDREAADLLSLFDQHGLNVHPDAEAALHEIATRQATEPQAVLATTTPTAETAAAVTVEIRAGVNEDTRLTLRELAGSLTAWNKATETWRIPVHADPARLLALLDEQGLRVAEDVRAALTAAATEQERNLADSVAITGAEVTVPGLGVQLLPHQHPAVAYLLRNRRVIVGDEMGLGKTITSLAALAAADAFPAVVACKPDLTVNWQREIATALPGRRVYFAEGMTPSDIPADAEIVVIGFTALSSRPPAPAATEKNRRPKRPERYLWVEKLRVITPRALIVDEGHLGKEVTAARSRALALLGQDVATRDGLVLDLTGTPLVNRPRELAQQLVTLGALAPKDEPAGPDHLFGEYGGFLFRYCGPVDNGYGWTFNGHSNTDELHRRLRAWGLYLRRGESALNLPAFDMRALVVEPDQLDPAAWAEYQEAEADLISYLGEQAAQIATALGEDPAAAAVRAEMNARVAEHLVRLNALRQIIGRAKVPAIAAQVADMIANGEKVMIAAHHRDVVTAYARQFGGLKIQGGQSAPEKEVDKARFQTEPVEQAPAITVAIGAGGVGHTLTAARLGVQAELCWTPGERNQMGKRIHRIGQTRPVTYWVAMVPGTVDEDMFTMLDRKQGVLDAILDGADITEDTDETAGAADVAWTLAQRGLQATAAS